MDSIASTNGDYRYPGSRPFYDNDIDRCLFFGRDRETQVLLHKVMADNLVVLYAKSGMGKTSLINAGLNQVLRDRGFIPLMIRFNNREIEPLQNVYAGIKEIAEQKSMDYEEGERDSLWQYFKTTAFWSPDDTLLKPVLIMDQFEEFFTLHSYESRKHFIQQLADIVNNNIPQMLRESVSQGESFPYSEKPPNIKIIISIREDYLGHLDEIAQDIPGIFQNRFRLLPLSREQARQAIVKPSQVKDEAIGAAPFEFALETVEMMLDFLCKRIEMGEVKITDEVESFQLQLLCRHVEEKTQEKLRSKEVNIVVKPDDLGGEKGIRRILRQFYDDQVKTLEGLWKKRRARKLCEKGLISVDDRRLSLEENEIKRKFGVTNKLLAELVNTRLVRSEPRVGSIYYELSHDTLVAPIRESQKKRLSKRIKIEFGILFIFILLIIISVYIGIKQINTSRYKTSTSYIFLGNKYLEKGNFNEAIINYYKSIDIIPNSAAYYNIGLAYSKKKKYIDAINAYKKAIEINPNFEDAYIRIEIIISNSQQYEKTISEYEKVLQKEPKKISLKTDITEIYMITKHFSQAINMANEVLKEKGISTQYRFALRFISISSQLFLLKQPEAVTQLKEFIEYYKSLSEDFEKSWSYNLTRRFINENKKLIPLQQTQLLRQLIDILESPKAEGDKKIKELEKSITEIFK